MRDLRTMAMVLVLACFYVAASRSATAQQLVSPQSPTVRLMIGSSDTSAGGYVAYEAGFFKKYGLNIELVQSKGGAATAAAVAGNAADIGDSNIVNLANARGRGIPFVIIAPAYVYDASDPAVVLAVAKTSTVKTAKDLNGAIIGEPSLGSTAEAAVNSWLEQNGGDVKSVKYVEITGSESVPALDAGRITAVIFQDPQLTEQRDRVRILSHAYDAVAKHYLISAWFTTSDWATKNPDLIRRFRLALADGSAWADKNPDAAKAALGKWLKMQITKIRHIPTEPVSVTITAPFLESAKKYGIIQKPVATADLIYSAPK